jgi:hypothetical protein
VSIPTTKTLHKAPKGLINQEQKNGYKTHVRGQSTLKEYKHVYGGSPNSVVNRGTKANSHVTKPLGTLPSLGVWDCYQLAVFAVYVGPKTHVLTKVSKHVTVLKLTLL